MRCELCYLAAQIDVFTIVLKPKFALPKIWFSNIHHGVDRAALVFFTPLRFTVEGRFDLVRVCPDRLKSDPDRLKCDLGKPAPNPYRLLDDRLIDDQI